MWNNEISNNESTEFVEQIKKANQMFDDSSLSHSEIHPEAVYMRKQFDPLNIRGVNMQSNHLSHSGIIIFQYRQYIVIINNSLIIIKDNRNEKKNTESLIVVDPLCVIDPKETEHNKTFHLISDEKDDAEGMFTLGFCYQGGIGIKKDENKAFIYYKVSADMGNISAILSLGNCYKNGIGVEKDENEAFLHFQKSANMENHIGIYGKCYWNI
ncbi:calmodulin-dependent protein kinase [Gigaspora margarita]|uniref:Calmodulin-dependent protein kinase n=1 Tax=Gigaspora margarita TaxID=4874 RepID=A0A8H3WZJ0_GIGMA|nr:calmodulin-dependent protein kinase [Gigaspora margarita]